MSWGKEQFKKAYNRAQNGKQDAKDLEYEATSCYWADYLREEYDNWPTMEQLRTGHLVSLLQKLQLKSAAKFLDSVYWW